MCDLSVPLATVVLYRPVPQNDVDITLVGYIFMLLDSKWEQEIAAVALKRS